MGVVSNILGPDLAMNRYHDSGGQVIELNEYVGAGKVLENLECALATHKNTQPRK